MDGITRLWNPQSRDKNLPFIITPYHDGPLDQDADQDSAPPPPPPKDPGYRPNNSPYGSSGFGQPSQTSLLAPKGVPNTPNTPAASRWQNLASSALAASQKVTGGFVSPSSSQVSLAVPGDTASTISSVAAGSSSSSGGKFIFKLPKLKRKPSRTLTAETSATSTEEESTTHSHRPDGDGSISSPWNFQHEVHVDGSLVGLPTDWADALQKSGYSVEEIRSIYARQRRPLPTSPRPPAPPSSASSSQFLSASNADSNTIVNPRPRKDSIKHLERSLSRKAGHNIKVIIPDPTVDDGDVTIAVATPVRRSPSTLRRLQAPEWPDPPPSNNNSDQTPSQHLTPNRIPAPPEKTNNAPSVGSPERSTGKIRQAIQNTITHARSTTSLRKAAADGQPSSSSTAGAAPPSTLPSSSTSTPSTPPRTKSVRRRKSEGPKTFWEEDESDDDESSDVVSPLPVGMRSPSTKSPRITSTLPPRLELNLPFDDS
ncbi:hypothetical protein FRC01_008850, partial [Tulasnella sp. 417]